jgi:hypothetical protein
MVFCWEPFQFGLDNQKHASFLLFYHYLVDSVALCRTQFELSFGGLFLKAHAVCPVAQETQGVTVAALGSDEFPAFFTPHSGCKVGSTSTCYRVRHLSADRSILDVLKCNLRRSGVG